MSTYEGPMEPYRPASAAAVDRLARELSALRAAQRARSTTPALAHSAIDDGALITTSGGVTTAIIGEQYDGTAGAVVVNGPVPPIPGVPQMQTVTSGIRVGWRGDFLDPQANWSSPVVAPLDFKHIEVEVSTSTTFASEVTRVGQRIASESGGYTFVPFGEGALLYARIRTRSHSGKVSDWSPVSGPVAAGLVGVGDVGFNIAQLGGARMFYQPTQPDPVAVGLGADDRAIWWDSDDGNRPYKWDGATLTWADQRMSGAALQPKSVHAGDLLVDGSVSAPLFQAVIVLATAIVAGDPNGDHARMNPSGFRVYSNDPVDGTPNEVIRMGTDTNDYFGVVNSAGELVASISDAGGGYFKTVAADSVTVKGTDFLDYIEGVSIGVVGRFFDKLGADITGVNSRYGVMETGAALYAGRAYNIAFRFIWRSDAPLGENDEIRSFIHFTAGAAGDVITTPAAPTINSTIITQFTYTAEQSGRFLEAIGSYMVVPNITTRFRFGISAERGVGTTSDFTLISASPYQLTVADLGPAGPISGQFTAMGGTLSAGGTGGTASPGTITQSKDTGIIRASAKRSYRGNDTLRTDTADVVHGPDPSGFNGDGKGHWRFTIPNITGTIDRVQVNLYTNHTYFSTGNAKFNLSDEFDVANPAKLEAEIQVNGFPKPGWKSFDLPAAWFDSFKNKTAITLTVGPSFSTDLMFYCRFSGTDCELRIWYTQ